jgi:hypothetical protein
MKILSVLLVTVVVGLLGASEAMAAKNVELLHGTVRSVGHEASGRAAVVLTNGRRVLTLRNFRIDPGPQVRVWLVPRSARGDGAIRRDYKDLGKLKGNKGNQQYSIPRSVDLRRYRSVIFWCVPFTTTLARANLTKS